MKIAIDIRNIGKGRTGDEVVFFELVRHLVQIDENNDYRLLIDTRSEESLREVSVQLGILNKKNFSLVQLGSGNKFVWNAWSVSQYCRREKIDVYHSQYIIPFFMPRHTKIVTHIHDVSFRVYKELITKTDAFFLNALIPRAVKRSDKVIAVSQFTKDEIKKYYGALDEKVVVVHNAVSMNCSDGIDEHVVREKYHLPERYVLMLGTMQPRKNIPCAIEAFIGIAKEFPDLHLVLAGKKAHNFDAQIEAILGHNKEIKDRIVFTGYVDEEDKCQVYRGADVFMFPSLYEGFGVPILEAFAAELPVVASDIAPHREVAGEGVLYFAPENVDQCRKVLYDALDNDNMRRNIIATANERKKYFSWEKSAQKLLMVYVSVQK